MRKIFYITFCLLIFVYALYAEKAVSMANPWIECNDDISCGAKKAGFNFPLRVKFYNVRAMDGLMEISFMLDKKRTVVVRKALVYDVMSDVNGIKDISGDYNKYPVNKTVKLKNGIVFNVRGNKKIFHVANFASESGYYSFYSNEGMKMKDLEVFYKLLEEAEAPRLDYDEKNNLTIEQLQNLRKVDGIVETVYTQDCFPRTLQKKGVSKECFDRANLGQDNFCSMSEIKMIKEYYKKGQNKDLNSCEEFCAQ